MIEFTVPFPPSVNRYYRHVGPRTLLSRQGREYREIVAGQVGDLLPEPLNVPVELELDVFPPDRRKRDLDNLLKSLIDALEHAGLLEDDSQIKKITAESFYVVPNGLVVVRVRERQPDGSPASATDVPVT